jgi:hypothetical protein
VSCLNSSPVYPLDNNHLSLPGSLVQGVGRTSHIIILATERKRLVSVTAVLFADAAYLAVASAAVGRRCNQAAGILATVVTLGKKVHFLAEVQNRTERQAV